MSKPQRDSHFRLKYIGYCLSQLPPDEAETTLDDFVQHAKFQLCVEKRVLMEDAIWDKYTDEQILVEYYGMLFSKSKEERTRFEAQMGGDDPDLHGWFDKMIEQNKVEMEAKASKLPDSVKFIPPALGEEG